MLQIFLIIIMLSGIAVFAYQPSQKEVTAATLPATKKAKATINIESKKILTVIKDKQIQTLTLLKNQGNYNPRTF